MMSDAIDDALDDDQAEEETEELANQVTSNVYFQRKHIASIWSIYLFKFLP